MFAVSPVADLAHQDHVGSWRRIERSALAKVSRLSRAPGPARSPAAGTRPGPRPSRCWSCPSGWRGWPSKVVVCRSRRAVTRMTPSWNVSSSRIRSARRRSAPASPGEDRGPRVEDADHDLLAMKRGGWTRAGHRQRRSPPPRPAVLRAQRSAMSRLEMILTARRAEPRRRGTFITCRSNAVDAVAGRRKAPFLRSMWMSLARERMPSRGSGPPGATGRWEASSALIWISSAGISSVSLLDLGAALHSLRSLSITLSGRTARRSAGRCGRRASASGPRGPTRRRCPSHVQVVGVRRPDLTYESVTRRAARVAGGPSPPDELLDVGIGLREVGILPGAADTGARICSSVAAGPLR